MTATSMKQQDHWQGETSSPQETMALGQVIGTHVRAGDLIALIGELGAGKTQFTRGLAQGLGIEGSKVGSPTFVLVHEYPAPAGRPILVHVDAYRVGSLEELESIGWDPAAGGGELRQQSVLLVEWADRLGGTLGDDMLEIRIEHLGMDQRQIQLQFHGSWRDRAGTILKDLPH